MLLAGAGLLGRSLANLIAVDKGFDPRSVIAFNLSTTQARYPTNPDRVNFFETTMERLRRIHGVQAVGMASDLPMGGGDTTGGVTFDGREFEPGQRPFAQTRIVSAGYFPALGIPIVHGRGFTQSDDARAEPVIVVSQSFARRWFPNEDPIGKRIGFNWDIEGFQTIIGVVADVKHNGLDDPDSPAIYIHHMQRTDSSFTMVVKTAGPPESLMPAIRSEIRAIDPSRPVSRVRTMTGLVSESTAARRLSLDLVAAFAGIGLLLAATGIYGVVNHATIQRSREFGIRLALGAETSSVRALVLRQGLVLAVAGVAIGLAGALALSGVIRAQLFGIEPTDPLTLAAVSATLATVALVACYLPARRATKISAAEVLRAD
jgi:predicted permease